MAHSSPSGCARFTRTVPSSQFAVLEFRVLPAAPASARVAPAAATGELLQFVVGPWFVSRFGEPTNFEDAERVDGGRRVSERTPYEGEHRSDLIVAIGGADRRHQPDGSFFP